MNRRPWLPGYITLFVVAMTLTAIGIIQSCPIVDDGQLTQGCNHVFVSSSASGHAINGLALSGVVVILGAAITFLRGQRPTILSFLVWASAGLLEPAIPASWYITPNPLLTVLLLTSSALAVLLAVPAGVSIARDAGEPEPSVKTRTVEG